MSLNTRILGVVIGIAVIATLHYTAGHDAGAHHLYRRLFYLPILAAAYSFGFRGGLGAAFGTVAVYVPHAFGLFDIHPDPASFVDKVAEMILYVGIGGMVGWFVDRERAVAVRLRGLLQERDLTIDERDGALDALREAQNRLAAAEQDAAMGHLTAGLAHEIRNPLASIRGSAEILRDAAEEDSLRRMGDLLVQETERLDGVLTRFLRFAGREPRREEPTVLSGLVDEVLELVTAEAQSRGVELHHLTCSVTPTVLLDAGQVRQVILNLVLNAMQAQPGGGTIRVVSGIAEDSPCPLFVRVEDSGSGVAPTDRAEVFHPYFSNRPGGTGLGLAVSRKVASEHGGTLTVAESPLGGASFELRLPFPSRVPAEVDHVS
jgi:signal transduction histidine kinase